MKVRNIINKAAVIGTGALMTGFTVSSALAYDLADYPAQFIVDGAFDGKIVVGANAATSDVLGSIDIAASLQAGSVTSEDVEVPGQAGSVNLQGDAFKIETSNDLLEMREPIGNVYDTLTETELEALQGGRVSTSRGATNYNQYLRFESSTGATRNLQEMAVNFIENEDREVADYLVIEDDNPFFEWEIEFTEGLKSRIDTTNTPNTLRDLEGRAINIFGTDFTIVNTAINTGSGTESITIELMAGDASDTLREGETKTYTIDGTDYEVTAVFISDPASGGVQEAKFAVNGEITAAIQSGDTETLNNGVQIGVREILTHAREGIVQFYLGANKIEFSGSDWTNNDLTSGEYDGNVEIGTESINDASVSIFGQMSGNDFSISTIRYRLAADPADGSILYIPEGQGVREFLDDPEAMLSPTFDIRFEGLSTPSTTAVEFRPRSDHSYEFRATSLRGKTYTVPFVTNRNGNFMWGDDYRQDGRDRFWFTEMDAYNGSLISNATVADALDSSGAFWIADEDYFVLSEAAVGSANDKTDSAILRYRDIDTDDKQLEFTDMSNGETRSVTYVDEPGHANVLGRADNFVVEGTSYTVWISAAAGHALAIDLDNSGNLTGAQVGFTTRSGATVNFDATGEQVAGTGAVGGNPVTVNMTIPASRFDDTSGSGEALWWTIDDAANDRVALSVSSSNHNAVNADSSDEATLFGFWSNEGDADRDWARLDYGALVEYYNPSGSISAESLTITMPSTQVGAQVFVTAGAVSRTGAGGVTREVVNPIAVGLAVLDTDAQGMYGNENLIIVGGPCANSVAAQFLGNPANCAEGFTPGRADIWAEEMNGNVAILVAGYEAQETLGAAYVLADYNTYLADVEGSAVEVVATDLSDLRVQAPTVLDTAEDME